jgi:hypothetical protein
MDSGKPVKPLPGTGVNDHAWERDHRHPTPNQLRAIGSRWKDAEAKVDHHQQEARLQNPAKHPGPDI